MKRVILDLPQDAYDLLVKLANKDERSIRTYARRALVAHINREQPEPEKITKQIQPEPEKITKQIQPVHEPKQPEPEDEQIDIDIGALSFGFDEDK